MSLWGIRVWRRMLSGRAGIFSGLHFHKTRNGNWVKASMNACSVSEGRVSERSMVSRLKHMTPCGASSRHVFMSCNETFTRFNTWNTIMFYIAVWITGTLYRHRRRFGSWLHFNFHVLGLLVSIQESWVRSWAMSWILNITVTEICDSITTNQLKKQLHVAKSFLKSNTSSAVKNFPAFYGTRNFVTAVTKELTSDPCSNPDKCNLQPSISFP